MRWSWSCWMIISHTVVFPDAVPPETPAPITQIKYPNPKLNHKSIKLSRVTDDERLLVRSRISNRRERVARRYGSGAPRRRRWRGDGAETVEAEAGEMSSCRRLHDIVYRRGFFRHRQWRWGLELDCTRKKRSCRGIENGICWES